MISYRTLKKLLGETSLERKCRLLFGVAVCLLILTSFWIYAKRTRALVEQQQVASARNLIPEILRHRHYQLFLNEADRSVGRAEADVPAEEMPKTTADTFIDLPLPDESTQQAGPIPPLTRPANWSLFLADDPALSDESDFDARASFNSDSSAAEFWEIEEQTDGRRRLRYYANIVAADSCIRCHNGTRTGRFTPGESVAIARVLVPMDVIDAALARNRAVLLGAGIITGGMAMLAAYAIVRYIIVKPVLHLQEVSEKISKGKLDERANLVTGDEFEELGAAFNRMLRHVMSGNEELRDVNRKLDRQVDELGKVKFNLERSHRLKDDFLAIVSHELKTPLNSILGFSEMLSTAANLDERQQRYVRNIRKSGSNLMAQINDLLDLAKIESGEMTVQAGDVSVDRLLREEVQQVVPMAESKNIVITVHSDSRLTGRVNQDYGKLRQILSNLLSNAAKFTPEGGRIDATSRLEGDDLILTVEDTGLGIPLQEQEHIFEKFRQGSSAADSRDPARREHGGTGLGLSIVRELSRLLGGDVSVDSEFGRGSQFTIRLPLVYEPPQKPEQPLESPSGITSGRITSVDLTLMQSNQDEPELDDTEPGLP